MSEGGRSEVEGEMLEYDLKSNALASCVVIILAVLSSVYIFSYIVYKIIFSSTKRKEKKE
jgi:hypothetical protein